MKVSQDLSSGSVVVKLARPLVPDAEVEILVQGTSTGGIRGAKS